MTKVTNLETAVGIVRNTPDKALALSEIMNILGVSRSNAFVYHTKASKILGSADKVEGVMGKVSDQYKKVTPSKTSKTNVSMSSASKKAAKLAEIDAFLASNKSAVGNPFAQLGA